MCFTLYLASPVKMPVIKYDQDAPAFNTSELGEDELTVSEKFSLPHVLYVGSHYGCGCEFRHALLERSEEWIPIDYEKEEDARASQKDQEALVNYLKSSAAKEFELYGCWDGDHELPIEYKTVIKPEDILQPDFYFRERGFYKIVLDA